MRHLVLCLFLALAAPVSGVEIKIDFSDFSAGSTPTNFHSAIGGGGQPGDWKILLDEVPPLLAPLSDKAPDESRRAVLAQTSQDPTDERYPMLVYDGETFKDFDFTTRFKIVSGVVEQMAGVAFRFQNASNFYVARISALGKNIAFYKMVDGKIMSPVKLPLEISAGTWHDLRIDCSGIYIECSVDGKKALPTITDNSPPDGKIGFWTKSDAVSYFSDPVISYTPRIPAAQALVDSVMDKQPRILQLRIYTLNDESQPRIIASKDKTEAGLPGTDAEKNAINGGAISYGRAKGVDTLVLPFRDRNGDPMAAVRLQLKSFIGETQQNALTRANMILKSMQAQVASSDQLMR